MPNMIPEEWIRSLGIGIPFALAAGGFSLTYAAAPGLATFSNQNRYAQLGLAVIMLASIGCYMAAAEAYQRMDTGWWVFRKDGADDGEVTRFDDDRPEPEGSD